MNSKLTCENMRIEKCPHHFPLKAQLTGSSEQINMSKKLSDEFLNLK